MNMDLNHVIEPERHGLWIAAGFALALLAFALAFTAMKKIDTVLVGTQQEIVVLNQKIDALKNAHATEHPPAAKPAAAVTPAK